MNLVAIVHAVQNKQIKTREESQDLLKAFYAYCEGKDTDLLEYDVTFAEGEQTRSYPLYYFVNHNIFAVDLTPEMRDAVYDELYRLIGSPDSLDDQDKIIAAEVTENRQAMLSDNAKQNIFINRPTHKSE